MQKPKSWTPGVCVIPPPELITSPEQLKTPYALMMRAHKAAIAADSALLRIMQK